METASDNVIRALESRPDFPAADAVALIANQTRLISPPGAPLQVAFADPGGSIYLWFPQTGELRRGRWRIEERVRELLQGGRPILTRTESAICYEYGGAIPNIFAPEHLRNPSCPSADLVRRCLLDARPGDIFGLARGSPGALGPIQVRKLDDLVRRVRG
jgi:hypothetical protein